MGRFKAFKTTTAIFPLLLWGFLICACQVNVSPAPTVAAIPTGTAPAATALPATATFQIASPTVFPPSLTPRPSATPGLAPSTATNQAPLTPGGPWLLYQRVLLYAVGGYSETLFVSNQDGSGSRIIHGPDCETSTPVSIAADPANRLIMLDGKFVLINLDRAVVQVISPDCSTRFTGSAASGLLASIDRAATALELRVYELPEGKLRSSFPIPLCSEPGQACGFDDDSGTWLAQWDPGGRFLIFPVIREDASSDLYLYDSQNGATRLLANIQDRVSRMWWSPGGTNIVLGVSPGGDFSLKSFWAVRIASGVARQYSTAEDYLADVEILDWLDENRFLFYRGSLQHVVTVGAYNLRMLDIRSGQETTLLGDGFLRADLDRQTGIVGMIVVLYNSQYEDGVYLVPAAKPTPQKIAPIETAGIYNTFWEEDLRLFVSRDPCQEGGQGLRAFDSKGRWHCAPAASPAEPPPAVDYPSPDGQWRALAQEGLWVESTGKPAVKVHDVSPTQVIWRPDSGGFFFIARMRLSYVSLPDLAVQPLDHPEPMQNKQLWGSEQVEYQWIESDSPR